MGKSKKVKDDSTSAVGAAPIKLKKEKKKDKKKKLKEEPANENGSEATPQKSVKEVDTPLESKDAEAATVANGGGMTDDGEKKKKKKEKKSKKDKPAEKETVDLIEPVSSEPVGVSEPTGDDDLKTKASKKKKSAKRKSLEAAVADGEVAGDVVDKQDKKGKKKKKTKEEDSTAVVELASPVKSEGGKKNKSKKKSMDKSETAPTEEPQGVESQALPNGEANANNEEPAKSKDEEKETKSSKPKKKKKSKRNSETLSEVPNGVTGEPVENGKAKSDGGEEANENQPEDGNGKKVKSKKKSKRNSEVGLQTPSGAVDGDEKPKSEEPMEEKSAKKSKKKRKKSDVTEPPSATPSEKPEADPTGEEEPSEKKLKTEGEATETGLAAEGNGELPSTTNGQLAQEEKEELPSGARAFRRVQAEQWLDKKGAWDNSYEATFGNEGWGAKAQEVLGKVRGKDFRHEKTKKKRGSYRGGVINSDAVNSIKFDSD